MNFFEVPSGISRKNMVHLDVFVCVGIALGDVCFFSYVALAV